MPNPMALRLGVSLIQFVRTIWLAPYRVAVFTGMGLLMMGVGLVWRWFHFRTVHFFGLDIDADLFFASGLLVFAMLVAILVPAALLAGGMVIWRMIVERIDPNVGLIRGILREALKKPSGLVYVATNYRGVTLEAYDSGLLRHQLARAGIDLAERQMLSELRRLGGQTLGEVDAVNQRFRHLRLGHMLRVIYDPKHGGGLLYYHVHANEYLLGVVVEVDPMEPKDGKLPPAYQGMEDAVAAIRAALGLAVAKGEAQAPAPTSVG